jgi:hypothetical protein
MDQEKLLIKLSVAPLEINEKLGFWIQGRTNANYIPFSGSSTASL